MRVYPLYCGVIYMSRTRTDLARLQAICKEYGKVSPKEWPEGLIGVGPDMRRWVKAQDDLPVTKPKKSSGKSGSKQESKSKEKIEE